MPKITNPEENITLSIDLFSSEYLDVVKGRPDFENWVPFSLELECIGERYAYPPETHATFNVYEIKNILSDCKKIVEEKQSGKPFDPWTKIFETWTFATLEGYFDLTISDPLEPDLIELDFWIKMGTMTNGALADYDKGFRFLVDVPVLKQFIEELSLQFQELAPDIEM